MRDTIVSDTRLAWPSPSRHDGHGGVADDLSDLAGLTAWLRQHTETLPDAPALVLDEGALAAVRDLRAAVHALFAPAVRPGAPSPADAVCLLPVPEAVARTPTVPVLRWTDGAEPLVHRQPTAAGAVQASCGNRARVARHHERHR